VTATKTHGYSRKRDLPADGGRPKVCPKCDHWFSQQPRERICAGCRPAWRKTLVAVRVGPVNEASSQVAGTYSDVLRLTFKPGVPLWRQLALEAAAEQRWSGRQR